jgi:hypothetical protein
MATINIFPDADLTPLEWTRSLQFTTHYEHVDTQDAYYINVAADSKRDSFGTDYNNQLEGDNITSVTVYARAKKQATAHNNLIELTIRDSSDNEQTSGEQSLTDSYVTKSYNFTVAPGGGSWTESDLDDLEIGVLSVINTKFANIYVDYLYAVVTYTEGATTLTTRLAHKAVLSDVGTARLAHGVSFLSPPYTFRPNDDVDCDGWTPDSTYCWQDIDEVTADDGTTKIAYSGTSIAMGDGFHVRCNQGFTLPTSSRVELYVRARKANGSNNRKITLYMKKGSSHYAAAEEHDLTTSWTTYSYAWDTSPWTGDWGNLADISFGCYTSYYYQSNTVEVTQAYLVIKPESVTRIAMSAPFKTWTSPDWWNVNWIKRRQINFGTNHSEIVSGHTVDFEIFTGYEKRVSGVDNGILNESVGHSCRQIVNYNGYTGICWMGYASGSEYYHCYFKRYKHSTDAWDDTIDVYATTTNYDTHYMPVMTLDNNGKVFLVLGGHDSYSHAKVSSAALDSEYAMSFSGAYTAISTGSTYPRLVVDSSNNYYIFVRMLSGGDRGQWGYVKSINSGVSWGSFQEIVDYEDYTSAPSIYCGGCIYQGGRFHAVITFWDYYGTANKGRGITYIYSTDAVTWYYADGDQACTTSSQLDYDDVNTAGQFVVKSSEGGTWPGDAPYYHTNSEALVIDGNNKPFFTYQDWSTVIGERCNLWFAKWTGSAWSKTNLSALSGAPKMFRYRQGGQIFLDGTSIFIYSFVPPSPDTEDYFGGELYRWRGTNYGTSWSHDYMTANTGYGAGMMSACQTIGEQGKLLLYCRLTELFIYQDYTYAYVKNDGDDLRIIRHDIDGNDYEYDRLPDRFQAEDTKIYFKVNHPVPANQNYHANYRWYVYYANSAATAAPNDAADVFTHYDGFENGYTTNVDLKPQGAWDYGDTGVFKVFSCNDMSGWASAHTNKLYSGAKFIKATGGTDDDVYKYLALDDHILTVQVWEEGGDPVYVAVEDGSSNTIKIALNYSEGVTYKINAGSWTTASPAITVPNGRYSEVKFWFDKASSEITIWVNGELVLDGNATMDSMTNLHLGCKGTGATHCIDDIKAVKYISNPPELTLGTIEGEDEETTARLAHKASLAYIRSTRIAHKADTAKVDVARIAHGVDPEKIAVARIAELLQLEATEKTRIAHKVVGDKVEKDRISHHIALSKTGTPRLRHHLVLEATAKARLAQLAAGEKHTSERLAHDTQLEAEDFVRVAHALVGDKTLTTRMMHTITPDKVKIARIMHLLESDKEMAVRVAHAVGLIYTDTARIAHELLMNKFVSARIAHVAAPEATDTDRLAHDIALEDEDVERIAHAVSLEDEDVDRIAHDLDMDKIVIERIMHDLDMDKETVLRICNLAVMDKVDIERIAHTLNLTYVKTIRLMHQLAMDKEVTSRLAHAASLVPLWTVLIAHDVGLEAEATTRIGHGLNPDKVLVVRLANWLENNKELSDRIAHAVGLDVTDYERIAHAVLTDKHVAVRLAHDVDPDKFVSIRLAHAVGLDAEATDRLALWCSLEAEDVLRLAHDLDMDKETIDRISHWVALEAEADAHLAHAASLEATDTTRISHGLDPEKTGTARVRHDLDLEATATDRIRHWADLGGIGTARIANLVVPEAVTTVRLPQLVPLLSVVTARIAMSVSVDKELAVRLRHWAAMEATASTRLTQLAALEDTVGIRLANMAALEYTATARLSNYIQLLSTTTARLAHRIAFYYLQLFGIHIRFQRLDDYTLNNSTIKLFDIETQNVKQYDASGVAASVYKITNADLSVHDADGQVIK